MSTCSPRDKQDLIEMAHAIVDLDNKQAAKVLSDARNKQPGPIYWTWVNGLISGWLTHTKYVAANAFYAGLEHGVTTPMAAMVSKVKELSGLGEATDRVFFGETLAANYGMIAATPSALWTAAKAVATGIRAPTENALALRAAAIARGDKVPASLERRVNQVTQLAGRPISGQALGLEGVWGRLADVGGRIIGFPGDAAGAIHTFFDILGERAGIESEAYAGAAKEGLSPTDADFWARRAELAANPTEEMRQVAFDSGLKGTFMQELGPKGKWWQMTTKKIPGLRWAFPFSHIPINLMKATYEYTPFAVLDGDMRANLMGKNGGRAQDMAIARMVVGSAVMGWFVNAQMNGRATGDLPADPKERDAWKLEGKQPNSILIGDYWVTYNRFGPAGDLANLGANIGYVVPHVVNAWNGTDDEAMAKATVHAASAAANIIVDEVGFQSLANLLEAVHDEKKGTAFVASQASSLIPFSSALSQTASVMDPHMREAKTFIDGIKYRIPGERETLLPKRDWSGQPIANPQYGNIIRQRQVNTDPVDMEMDRLGIHPAPPQNRVGTVQLPPALYDRYQELAGGYTRMTLENMVKQPGWYDVPAFARAEVFRNTIAATRAAAQAAIQAANPQIIQQGVENVRNRIEGNKPTKLQAPQ